MKLIYLTSKTYPASTADHFFILEMSRAFAKIFGSDFLLLILNNHGNELENIPHVSFGRNIKRGKRIYYFFRLPFFIFMRKLTGRDTVFFSNDQYLLEILFFWRSVFRFKYLVISDWHMMFSDKREKVIARKSDGLITTTEHLKNLIMKRLAVSDKKIFTTYGGVDLQSFCEVIGTKEELRKKFGLPADAFLIGYVGFYKTLGMGKGIDTMIDALAFLEKNIHMVFVGGKEKEIKEYGELAESKGLLERAHFIPVIPSGKIPAYQKALDVLVIPYPDKPHFRDYGFPMKAYEYLASKKPIIFSNLPIMSEVLGDCAISFIPDDASDLAKKIVEAQKNKVRSDTLAEKAFGKAKECSWQKRAEKIVNFISSLSE